MSSGSPASVTPSVWISPDLGLGAGKTVADALAEPFDGTFEVTLRAAPKAPPTVLKNCLDYLAVEHTIYSAGPTVVTNVLYSRGARCDALDLLRCAHAATHPASRKFSFRHLDPKRMPPGLALIISTEDQEKAAELTRKGGSLLDMEDSLRLRAKDDTHAELVAEDWTADLTLYGRADFLGNGEEQLLVRSDSAVKQGSYRSAGVFVLSGASKPGTMRIEKVRP